MVVIVLTACPVGLRGDLTRWLLEISPGVFVGHLDACVRENCGSESLNSQRTVVPLWFIRLEMSSILLLKCMELSGLRQTVKAWSL